MPGSVSEMPQRACWKHQRIWNLSMYFGAWHRLGGISVSTWDLKNMAYPAAPWAGKQELKHIYFVFQLFNPEVWSRLWEIQRCYRKQRLLGVGITPQKDLGCEQRCAANYQRSGLQGWMVRASKGAFTGQKHPSQQWHGVELVGCFPATSLGTGCDFNSQLYRKQPCHQARTVTSPLFF